MNKSTAIQTAAVLGNHVPVKFVCGGTVTGFGVVPVDKMMVGQVVTLLIFDCRIDRIDYSGDLPLLTVTLLTSS